MATVAIRFSAKEFVATFRGIRIEIDSGTRFHRRQSELVELQRRQLARDPVTVRVCRYVTELGLRGDRELFGIIETLVKERSFSMQFVYCNECIPIADSAPTTRPRM